MILEKTWRILEKIRDKFLGELEMNFPLEYRLKFLKKKNPKQISGRFSEGIDQMCLKRIARSIRKKSRRFRREICKQSREESVKEKKSGKSPWTKVRKLTLEELQITSLKELRESKLWKMLMESMLKFKEI